MPPQQRPPNGASMPSRTPDIFAGSAPQTAAPASRGLAPCAIIGNGVVGNLLASRLRPHRKVAVVPARDLVTPGGAALLRRQVHEGANIILAHGREVRARTFRRDYRDLLASRIAPLYAVARILAASPTAGRLILISSTLAAMPVPTMVPNLIGLQLEFERAFDEIFRQYATRIVRVGAILDECAQIRQRLPRLKASVLVKRIRPSRRTAIPWVDGDLLAGTVTRALEDPSAGILTAAYRHGLDWSELMDSTLGTRVTITSDVLFFGVWWLLGVRPEFLTADVSHIWPADANSSAEGDYSSRSSSDPSNVS